MWRACGFIFTMYLKFSNVPKTCLNLTFLCESAIALLIPLRSATKLSSLRRSRLQNLGDACTNAMSISLSLSVRCRMSSVSATLSFLYNTFNFSYSWFSRERSVFGLSITGIFGVFLSSGWFGWCYRFLTLISGFGFLGNYCRDGGGRDLESSARSFSIFSSSKGYYCFLTEITGFGRFGFF